MGPRLIAITRYYTLAKRAAPPIAKFVDVSRPDRGSYNKRPGAFTRARPTRRPLGSFAPRGYMSAPDEISAIHHSPKGIIKPERGRGGGIYLQRRTYASRSSCTFSARYANPHSGAHQTPRRSRETDEHEPWLLLYGAFLRKKLEV